MAHQSPLVRLLETEARLHAEAQGVRDIAQRLRNLAPVFSDPPSDLAETTWPSEEEWVDWRVASAAIEQYERRANTYREQEYEVNRDPQQRRLLEQVRSRR